MNVIVFVLLLCVVRGEREEQPKILPQFFPTPPPCQPCMCGVANQWTRIIGGTETFVNEFPWMAALMVQRVVTCGATLLNDRYLITAAHCVSNAQLTRRMLVLLSDHNHHVNDEAASEVYFIDQVIVHSSFTKKPSGNPQDNDVALIKLTARVRFRRGIEPACLPLPAADFTNSPGTVVGWGVTVEGGAPSAALMAVQVPVLSNDACLQIANYTRRDVTDNQLCAGFLDGGYDSCQGDSGGPLIVKDEVAGRWIIAGIVSWGSGCARKRSPGIYTRVSRYRDWIAFNTQDACQCIF